MKTIMLKYIYIILLVFFVFSPISIIQAENAEKKQKTTGKIPLSVNDQRKLDYYFYEAANAKALNNYDSCFDYLNYCFQLDSTNAAVLYEIGNFYDALEDKSKALTFFQKAVQYDKENFYYNSSLANLYFQLNQYHEAINVFEYLIAKEPLKIELYPYLSESYRLSGNLEKAIEALDKVETIVGLNEKISLQKFQLYSVLDNKDKAFAEFEKYIEKYPKEIRYYTFLGNLYMDDNRMEDAYMILIRAKAIDPDDPYLIAAMATYYEKMNRKDDAERELHAALLSHKLDVDTKLGILAQYIGTLQRNEGNTDRANMLLDTLMVEHPLEPKLNLMYGNLLMVQNKMEEAQFHFRIFAESNPTNPFGWEQLLKTIPPDSIDQTIKICETAISYIPDEPLFYFYLGIGEYQKEEIDKALNTLKTGITKITDDDPPLLASEFYGMVGSLFYEKQESDSAFVAFDKALEYNPYNLGVLNNYSYYLSLEKKELDKAEKMSSITIKEEPTNPTYLDTYGWILFEQGDYVTSKIYLQNAVRYSEEKEKDISAEVLEHYGDVLFKTGDKDKAVEYWKRAKEKEENPSPTLKKKIETETYIEK